MNTMIKGILAALALLLVGGGRGCQQELQIASGATVLLMSDGLPELFNR